MKISCWLDQSDNVIVRNIGPFTPMDKVVQIDVAESDSAEEILEKAKKATANLGD